MVPNLLELLAQINAPPERYGQEIRQSGQEEARLNAHDQSAPENLRLLSNLERDADVLSHPELAYCRQTARQNWRLAVPITVFVILADDNARTLVETLVQATRLVEVCIQ